MSARSITCAFTGHRPKKLPWGTDEGSEACRALKRSIADTVEALYEAGFRHFICGMALGADMYFGEAVAALREEREDVTLEAAVPFSGQADRWSAGNRLRYERLLACCDERTVLAPHFTHGCLMERNRYMVDHAAVLVAVFDGSPGGTKNTIAYAGEQGVDIVCLPVSV